MTTTLGRIGLYVERLLLQHASLQAQRLLGLTHALEDHAMRAAYYERRGPPREVPTVGELPDPVPGQVQAQAAVSAVNSSDT
jgi:hypothetical protein